MGENGCGKSSVLEAILLLFSMNGCEKNKIQSGIYKNREIIYRIFDCLEDQTQVYLDQICFNFNSGDKELTSDLYYVSPSVVEYEDSATPENENSINFYNYQESDVIKFINERETIWGTGRPLELLKCHPDIWYIDESYINSSGFIAFLNIEACIFRAITAYTESQDRSIILIEEPETYLHPKLQKMLPKILNTYEKFLREEQGISMSNIQFFISTHSPFIVSASGKLEEDQFEKEFQEAVNNNSEDYQKCLSHCKSDTTAKNKWRKEFYKPSQKVYQIKDGVCKKSVGCWGFDMVAESSIMLGAGLSDVLGKHKEQAANDCYLIYCEGGDGNSPIKDAKIFNLLAKEFKEIWTENVLFIGCGGYLDVILQTKWSQEFYLTQKGNTQILGLLDGDRKVEYGSFSNFRFLNCWDLERFLLQDTNDQTQKNKQIIKKAEEAWKAGLSNKEYLKTLSKEFHNIIFDSK